MVANHLEAGMPWDEASTAAWDILIEDLWKALTKVGFIAAMMC